LNTQTKTLHFFVDDTQLSHRITNIYTTPLSFGISALSTDSSSVEIISFLLLKKGSVDNYIKCAEYDWVGKEEELPSVVHFLDISEGDSDIEAEDNFVEDSSDIFEVISDVVEEKLSEDSSDSSEIDSDDN
jgi:hypothetical protein